MCFHIFVRGHFMKTRLSRLVIAVLAVGLFSWGAPNTSALKVQQEDSRSWTGVVSDSNCGAKHSTASNEAASCVEKCVSAGAQYVLVINNKVYQLDAQDKFADLGGKSVKVTGSLEGNTIHVASVKAP
jgi:hypothetical protein